MGKLSQYLYRTYRASDDYNKEIILKMLGACRGRLLDCGCGDGEFTEQIGRLPGVTGLYGIETVAALARAACRRGVRTVASDLNRSLPFSEGFFDILHANQVIEHLHSTDQFLREARRVLKPTGVAVLSTNNLASWHNIFSLVLGMQPPPAHVSSEIHVGNLLDPKRHREVDRTEASHLRIFSYQALKELCEYHGFKVSSLRTTGYYPLPPRLGSVFNRIDRRHGAFLIIELTPLP